MVLSYSNGCHVLLPTGPIRGRLEGVRHKTVVKRGFTIERAAKNQMHGALSDLARWRYSAFFSELAPDFLKASIKASGGSLKTVPPDSGPLSIAYLLMRGFPIPTKLQETQVTIKVKHSVVAGVLAGY